jgi:glycosyltransferase involved in cell wall biosynthesis
MATLAGGHAGVSRYTAALSRGLDRVAPEFDDLQLEALTTPAGAAALAFERIPVNTVGLPGGAERSGWVRLLLEQALAARRGADLLHFFDLIGPVVFRRRRFVATIHDAAVAHGFEFTRLRRAYKRPLQPWALRHARAVVAVSAFARDEAVRRLGGDADRIRVIHSGPGLIEPPAGRGLAQVPEAPYVLFVGTLADNKNLPFLVRAFDAAGVDVDLVLAGRRGSAFEELRSTIAAVDARARIRLTEDVSDAALDDLYRGAVALLHPSRYEGFGFTPLEAMARGCPVLLSDIPPLREVSGEGGLVLPLDDEAVWSQAIRRVVNDEALRADLRRRGGETVSRYSWDETARRLCELFLEVGAA